VDYKPTTAPPVDHAASRSVIDWVSKELLSLARSMVGYRTLDLELSYRAPDKPRVGMVVCADGVKWNPGSGEGLYRYTSGGTWKYLE